ncbi:MAG: amidohydrolase family protein [Chloroflexi bacterium]|nr:amidohydrolase family protein [Chloroflexota bacterium]
MKTVVTNCHLIDVVSDGPRPDASVAIEDGKITAIASGGGAVDSDGARVIDAQGGWLLPGLWDVHVHLMFPDPPPATIPGRVIKYGLNAMEGLTESGVTGIRSGGIENWIDVAWRDAFDSGAYLGPRVFASGYFLTTTGGHAIRWPFSQQFDGPEGFIKGVREQIRNGVDHIKLNLSGGIMGPDWDRHWHSFFLQNELEATFEICHQRGMKVMSHAANPNAVKDAIRLGTWTVEHGYIMDDECIQMFLDRGVIYVPTLGISHLTPRQATNEWEQQYVEMKQISGQMLARADAAVEEHTRWFRKALDSGVKMALGSDLGPVKDAVHLEMGLWVRDGATPMQAIKAATKTAAETCEVGDVLGTVEVGKIADLIVVGADPLEDIANLRKLKMVFKDGKLVVDKREKN